MYRFKTHPCVLAERPHVEHMRAFCRYTRMRCEPTHGDVFNHTHGEEGRGGRVVVVVFSSLTFSLPSLSLFRRSFSLLSSRSCRLSPLSATMTMITRPVGLFLCTHGSDLPESQSAGTLAHSLFGRTCSYHVTVQASCHLE